MELRKHRRSVQNEVAYVRGSSSGNDDDDSAFDALELHRGSSLSSPVNFISGWGEWQH